MRIKRLQSFRPTYLLFSVLVLTGCKNNTEVSAYLPNAESKIKVETKTLPSAPPSTSQDTSPAHLYYPFLRSGSKNLNLYKVIPVPEGYERVEVKEKSFAEWLRFLPAKESSEPVKLYNGALKSSQDVHHLVVNIDVGKRDLQQCADAVMRLRAEYLYSQKDFEKIHFNFTSGDKVSFSDWMHGRKPVVAGNSVRFTERANSIDDSYSNFKKYLTMIFSYAGTASLSKEMTPVNRENLQIGDVFIQGGFPGHAVLVIDVANNHAGEKIFLLAQSYMPAQDFHILKNFNEPELSPWYSLSFGDDLATPEWMFTKNDLKRFN